MSPAMVKIRSPTTTSPSMQSKRSTFQNQNPKGQISPSPFLFDLPGGFSSSNQLKTQSKSMNSANLGHRNEGSSDSNFASPAPSLSKPRLVKVRRHFVSHPSKPTAASESRVSSGYNPFRSDSSVVSSSSGASDLENFAFGKSDDAGFVFGADRRSDPVSDLNLKNSVFGGNADTAISDEMQKLKIGSGTAFFDSKDAAFSFTAGVSNSKNSGVGGNAGTMISDELRKLNIGSGTAFSSTGFTGVTDSVETPAKDVFIFGRSAKKTTSNLDQERTVNNLPDEIRKLNIKDSGNGEGVEKNKDSGPTSTADQKDGFVFGSSNIATDSFGGRPDKIEKLNVRSRREGSAGIKNMEFSSRTSTNALQENADDNARPAPFTFGAGERGNDFKPSEVSVSVPADPLVCRAENKTDFSFMSSLEGLRMPHIDFKTPKNDASSSTESFFAGLSQNLEFGTKSGAVKDMKSKKKRGTLRKPIQTGKHSISREKNSQESAELDSPGRYSPMDFSPYEEILTADQCSRETSIASDEYVHFGVNHASTDTHPSSSMNSGDEDLISATNRLDINEGDFKCRESKEETPQHHVEAQFSSIKEFDSGAGNEVFASKTENGGVDNDVDIAAVETEATRSSSVDSQGNDDGMKFNFAFTSDETGETSFTFAASPASQGPLSAAKRNYRKKNHMKVGQDSVGFAIHAKAHAGSPSTPFFPLASSSLHPESRQGNKGDSFVSGSKGESGSEADKGLEVKQESISTAAASAAAQEACEKWRLRGNQAYSNGYLSKAEDYYTRGVNCVSPNETSRSCVRALLLCYSNRAATRMSLGRMRAAIADCMMAAAIDPSFLKVTLRAANCHLALGEIENAIKHFNKCLQSGSDVCLDRKLIIEAADGLQKAQQVAEYMSRSAELLRERTSNDAATALKMITEALAISPHSEKLIEMKAETLLMIRKYEEVVQLCEQSLESVDRNSALVGADTECENVDGSESEKSSPAKLWRWRLISKSFFYLGRLEEALDLLQKHEQVGPITEKYGSKTSESSVPFTFTVRELLRHKGAGNEAFQAGRHLEAIEHYSAALSCNVESRPFAAICFCNRAAAHQAIGQITDAIADCSLAIALDANYPKAISRRATLHEVIRDYGQAINDLHRLISLLEKQTEDNACQSGTIARSSSSVNDLRQAHLRLATMEEEAKKEIPLDMYLILGIESSCTTSDIKKAYRKAALRHHPDKAGQFLARSDNGDDGLWKEVADEVHKDADRLFKMIGEAYAVISDPVKRSRYDAEEEIRNIQKKGNGSGTPKTQTDVRTYPFDKSSERRQWRDPWKSSSKFSNRYY